MNTLGERGKKMAEVSFKELKESYAGTRQVPAKDRGILAKACGREAKKVGIGRASVSSKIKKYQLEMQLKANNE